MFSRLPPNTLLERIALFRWPDGDEEYKRGFQLPWDLLQSILNSSLSLMWSWLIMIWTLPPSQSRSRFWVWFGYVESKWFFLKEKDHFAVWHEGVRWPKMAKCIVRMTQSTTPATCIGNGEQYLRGDSSAASTAADIRLSIHSPQASQIVILSQYGVSIIISVYCCAQLFQTSSASVAALERNWSRLEQHTYFYWSLWWCWGSTRRLECSHYSEQV